MADWMVAISSAAECLCRHVAMAKASAPSETAMKS